MSEQNPDADYWFSEWQLLEKAIKEALTRFRQINVFDCELSDYQNAAGDVYRLLNDTMKTMELRHQEHANELLRKRRVEA